MPSGIAIFELEADIVNRYDHGGNASPVSFASYCSGEVLFEERTGETHQRHKGGVYDNEIMTSADNPPEWIYDRGKMWNDHQLKDKQWNAQLFKRIDMALPKAFDPEYNKELTRQWVKEHLLDRYKGIIADVAWHDMESHNPHAHIMLTMRHIEADGFGNKNRSWNEYNPKLITIPPEIREQLGFDYTTQVGKWRASWCMLINEHLEKQGYSERVTHEKNSKTEGIPDLENENIPQAAYHMEKRGELNAASDYVEAVKSRNKLRRQAARFEEQLEDVYEVYDQHSFMDRIGAYWDNFQKRMIDNLNFDDSLPNWHINHAVISQAMELDEGIQIE